MCSLRSLSLLFASMVGAVAPSLYASANNHGPTVSNILAKSMLSNKQPTSVVRITFDTPPSRMH